jgi:DNA-binding transcriptional ArsR family regulator
MSDVSIWTALPDPKRCQITLLEKKPRTTSELSSNFDVSRFAVMKHLKVLEQRFKPFVEKGIPYQHNP